MANTPPRVLLIATQDTKEAEARFLRQCLEEGGCAVVHLDASVRRDVGGAEIRPDLLAAAAGTTMAAIRAIGHEGKILDRMIDGAVAAALGEDAKAPLAGILAIGGSMGTSLGTAVMRAFPLGIPKVMISTLASGFTDGFVQSHDITMVNAVCDIAGINSISRDIYRNAAFGVAGAARAWQPKAADSRPLALMSTLGTTEAAARAIRASLEEQGFEVMVFHSTGAGGRTLDALASDPRVRLVVDLSLVEINDYLQGGICSAGPTRGAAAVQAGVPLIMAPGNCDFFIMPSAMATSDDAFGGRRFHIHNAALTAVRTTLEDLRKLADHLAGMLAEARAPVVFAIPLQGFSHHDSPEGHLHDLSIPPEFADHVRHTMPPNVIVRIIDTHINDQAFADLIVESALESVGAVA